MMRAVWPCCLSDGSVEKRNPSVKYKKLQFGSFDSAQVVRRNSRSDLPSLFMDAGVD
jgi:hypothetical protein